jgi:hypothetical protein
MATRVCPRCQSEVSEGGGFCPQCGQALPATAPTFPSPQQPTGVRPTPVAPAVFKFDAHRWSREDRITGIATALLFIALFLPWFGVFGLSINGLTGHGFLYVVLFVSLGILVYLGARAGWDEIPLGIPLAHAPIILVATCLNLALVILGFALKPGGTSWDFGAFMALVTAAAAAAPVAVPAFQSWRARR